MAIPNPPSPPKKKKLKKLKKFKKMQRYWNRILEHEQVDSKENQTPV